MIESPPPVSDVSAASCCGVPLTPDQAAEMAVVLKALSDPVRLRIASIVACCEVGEICMGDIAAEFDVSGPTISHHLRKLREAGVLASERRATEVYYSVRPERLGTVMGQLASLGLA
ncbi:MULTISPECIES: metalloregulator ArsR/SmtB family transcription factor [unclassified Streptomyces]|uniref:ArsR/SmtB family transcription factor n=1 Tax=unclassified Streptomyces TaxID=2593676 RepID=UPI0023656374|nr:MULTISPECIES: metalloregulator ArsR/SmtB family transcription factor [unclassified Streptomyces]MDF3139970.1 metalloregulator ArsR/SmtB family transcription factor [Streptomyces sp. T21Q-yed]WDF39890.1 metalloregulator ArsR/SmtB family transcription factor [Streptomyces sp. T12]